MGMLPINYFFMNFTFKAICLIFTTGNIHLDLIIHKEKNQELGQNVDIYKTPNLDNESDSDIMFLSFHLV